MFFVLFFLIYIFIAAIISISVFIMCVILCLFSTLRQRVGTLQISMIIIIILQKSMCAKFIYRKSATNCRHWGQICGGKVSLCVGGKFHCVCGGGGGGGGKFHCVCGKSFTVSGRGEFHCVCGEGGSFIVRGGKVSLCAGENFHCAWGGNFHCVCVEKFHCVCGGGEVSLCVCVWGGEVSLSCSQKTTVLQNSFKLHFNVLTQTEQGV